MELKSLSVVDSQVESGTSVVEYVVIPVGKSAEIISFEGSDSTSAKASCQLIWDHGGANEELWIINNGPGLQEEFIRAGDGVKKLAIILNNDCTSDYAMSAYCEYKEK